MRCLVRSTIHVLGAGGHALVVLDTLESMGVENIVIYDDNVERTGERIGEFEIRGPLREFAVEQDGRFVVAIGDNLVRMEAYLTHLGHGDAIIPVHISAVVSPGASLGSGCVVFPKAVVNRAARIGDNVIVNTGAIVEHDCKVADHAHIACGAALCGAVSVGEGAMIGANATVLPGVSVGAWAVVGAGAVITRDVPAGTVVKNVF